MRFGFDAYRAVRLIRRYPEVAPLPTCFALVAVSGEAVRHAHVAARRKVVNRTSAFVAVEAVIAMFAEIPGKALHSRTMAFTRTFGSRVLGLSIVCHYVYPFSLCLASEVR